MIIPPADVTVSDRGIAVVSSLQGTETSVFSVAWESWRDNLDAWRRIDYQLQSWKANPRQVEDDYIIPPNIDTIETAMALLAHEFRRGVQPFSRVVPSGDAGIVFERIAQDYFEAIELAEDGAIERRVFKDWNLVLTEPYLPHFSQWRTQASQGTGTSFGVPQWTYDRNPLEPAE